MAPHCVPCRHLHPLPPSRSSSSSPLDTLSFSIADAAFLRAMAMRPRLPEGNICWDDSAGDHSLVSNWHAQAWQMYQEATAAPEPSPQQVFE